MSLTYGSVCSGIEAATVAWHPLGWRPAFFSEIAPFPRAVLAHHYPTVPLRGDFTEIREGDHAAIDLLVGGTPCQSFSVAGLGKGLDDDRGKLALEYLKLAQRLRPRWVVWENVPGVLSNDGGRAFGSFLGGLAELGYGWAYRVLDAEYFGVPQRRNRVFVVGCAGGSWQRAAAVLLERSSLCGNPPPSREAGEDPARCLTAGTGQRYDAETDDLIPVVGNPLGGHHGRNDLDHDTYLPVAHTLRGEGFDASEDGTGRGTPLVPVAFAIGSHAGAADGDQTNRSHAGGGPVGLNISEECAYSLRAGRTQAVAHAFDARQSDVIQYGPISGRLDTDGHTIGVRTGSSVRRLTPTECERLQGFPDGHTAIPWRGASAEECPDGPRYRAVGNSMAVPVMAWIGRRIAAVEAL